jgi:hypothetical protein
VTDNGTTALQTRQQETALSAPQQQTQLAHVGSSNPLAIGPAQWDAMQRQAKMFVDSGFLPSSIKTPAQAIAIVVTGYELGIPAMTALRTIHIVQGRPTLSATLMAALIQKAHGDDALVLVSSDDKQATYRFKRRGWADYTSYSYTIEMAQKAGLVGKDTWKGHPAAMLRARCISSIATANFQDVTLGLYTPEELDAPVQVFDSGEIRYDPGSDPNVVNATSRTGPTDQRASDFATIKTRVKGIYGADKPRRDELYNALSRGRPFTALSNEEMSRAAEIAATLHDVEEAGAFVQGFTLHQGIKRKLAELYGGDEGSQVKLIAALTGGLILDELDSVGDLGTVYGKLQPLTKRSQAEDIIAAARVDDGEFTETADEDDLFAEEEI